MTRSEIRSFKNHTDSGGAGSPGRGLIGIILQALSEALRGLQEGEAFGGVKGISGPPEPGQQGAESPTKAQALESAIREGCGIRQLS